MYCGCGFVVIGVALIVGVVFMDSKHELDRNIKTV